MATPPSAPVAPAPAASRRRRPWRWPGLLLAFALLAAVANGLWQLRPDGRSLNLAGSAVQHGQVSLTLTYVASLRRYRQPPDVPAWAMPAYPRSPVFLRRLFDQAYGFFVPHFRRPPAGYRFLELVGTGRAPAHSQPGFGPGQDPRLDAGGAPTRLEEVAWTEPGDDGVYRLRLLFALPGDALPISLNLSIAGERFSLAVPEP